MSFGETRVLDWGTKLRLTVKEKDQIVPLDGATEYEFIFLLPDDTVMKRNGTLETDGTDGKVYYIFVKDGSNIPEIASNLDGTWQYQLRVLFPSGEWRSDIHTIPVYLNLE